MPDKRIDIEYAVVSLPQDVAESLISQGIAKSKEKGKINKKPEGDK